MPTTEHYRIPCISCGHLLPKKDQICVSCYETLDYINDIFQKRKPSFELPIELSIAKQEFETHTIDIYLYSKFVIIKHKFKSQYLNEYNPESIFDEKISDKEKTRELLRKLYKPKCRGLTLFSSPEQLSYKFVLLNYQGTVIPNDWSNIITIEFDEFMDGHKLENYLKSRVSFFTYSFKNICNEAMLPITYSFIGGQYNHWYATCSDNECPCPNVMLMKGQGYFFIEIETVNEKKTIKANLTCEEGARKRNLDLISAHQDAKMWWETGKIPNRVSLKNFSTQKAPIVQSSTTTSQIALNQQLSSARQQMINTLLQPVESPEKYLFVDVETNGLPINRNERIHISSNWPYIVQISWLIYDVNGKLLSKNNYLIKPNNFRISNDSYIIHGISEEKANRFGVDCNIALTEFNRAMEDADMIIGHNIDFDSKIIQAEMFRHNVSNKISEKKHFCTMENSKQYCDIKTYSGLKNPRLSDLYLKVFNKTLANIHNSETDILATAECFWKLKSLNVF